MNRDYFPNTYMQLTELQPPLPYQRYDFSQASPAAASPYEMTAGGARPAPHHHHHDPRKRRSSHYGDDYEPRADSASVAMPAPSSRKRKASSFGAASAYEDDSEDGRSARTLPDRKQNHSEIEKRRRDKMNTYISELAAMVPMCGAMARKLDKLTVLRMAVQHMRAVRGALTASPLAARPRPHLVPERDLNKLILHAAHDAVLLVVGCDRGRLLYVSASVTDMLHYEQSELLGQSMFDILHPKDVAKVKEQLSSSDLSPRERLIDAKTMLPVRAELGAGTSRLSPGARRSFFCRIKCRSPPHPAHPLKEDPEPAAKMRKKHEKKYAVVQCTGYLKSWASAEMSDSGPGSGGDEEASSMSCLVAVGRALPDLEPPPAPAPSTRRLQFMSRHAIDGKYLFVDQRVTLALGYLPQELLGTSLYETVRGSALRAVARAHKAALVRRAPTLTALYAARRKDGSTATMHTVFKPFRNPWTKDVECILAQNTVESEPPAPPDAGEHADLYLHEGSRGSGSEGDAEVQRLIDSQVESHKIGSAIAEDALRRPSADYSPELPADLLQDAVFNHQALVDNILGDDSEYHVKNNVPLSAASARSPGAGAGAGEGSPPLDGNGEAAMAVIMSLLEADAGLGGPVNFSGLPWPLP